ncbi:MAG: phosphatidate cytidylyltransferase, partial [Candidatus Binataceae bacterium]
MLETRFWTAAVALPAVLAAVLLASDQRFTLIVAAFGAWALYEIAAMTGATKSASRLALVILAGGVPLAIELAVTIRIPWLVAAGAIVAMATLVGLVAVRGANIGVGRSSLALVGAACVGMLFPFLGLARNLRDGAALFTLTLLLVVASDTGAYFGGVYLGRHKLAPRVSPNKTVEGAVAGLLASLTIALALRKFFYSDWEVEQILVFGAAVALLAQLGDLANSAFKRCAKVKDSGWLFPGHGGLLDRAFSLVFAATFAYYWA